MDRGGWENHRARSHETPKQTAPLTTSTPQPTTTPTRTTTLGTDPQVKESPATSRSPGGPPTIDMPSLQELWQKMSRFIEAQEAQHKLEHPPQQPPPPKPTSTELLPYPDVPPRPDTATKLATRQPQRPQPLPTPTSTTATQRPPPQYIYTPEHQPVAQACHIPAGTTLDTLKTRILASWQTALVETDKRISHGETTEEDLRRDLEDQFARTLHSSQ